MTDLPQPSPPRSKLGSFRHGIRVRLVASFLLLLVLAGAASVLVARQVLLIQLDKRIDEELVQETKELRRLASGNNPATGEPFAGDVRKIFRVFLERNVPSRHEALISFVDGELFLRSRTVDDQYRLDEDPELVNRWANLEETRRDSVETPAGIVTYMAIPLQAEGETGGVFVVAIFTDLQRSQADPAVLAAAATAAVVTLFGAVLAWRIAGRILRPVGAVRETALTISELGLTRRIEIDGDDEIADLARSFNQMLDRLEHAFTTQKRFIDDAAHELRTPITVIRGHIELLDEDPVERQRAVALVLDELDRMTRFVDDLLLLARSERPDFLDLGLTHLEELIEEVHRKAGALGARDWQVDQAGRGIVVADRQRLTQALMQLAVNACEHTSEGDEIGFGSRIEGDKVRLWVRDEGTGIPASEQERIFDRFRRGPGQKRTGGAGIGLAIVKAIADAHRGTVEVQSKPGEGTLFTLTLPVDQPILEEEGHR